MHSDMLQIKPVTYIDGVCIKTYRDVVLSLSQREVVEKLNLRGAKAVEKLASHRFPMTRPGQWSSSLTA
jgi:hypothetical protein